MRQVSMDPLAADAYTPLQLAGGPRPGLGVDHATPS